MASPTSISVMLYVDDAVRATRLLMEVDPAVIRTRWYNVTGMSQAVTAGQVKTYLQQRYPTARISYNDGSAGSDVPVSAASSRPTGAAEWGWKAESDTLEKIVAAFERICARSREHLVAGADPNSL